MREDILRSAERDTLVDFMGNAIDSDKLYVRAKTNGIDGPWNDWIDVLKVRGGFVLYSNLRHPELSRLYWRRHYSKPDAWVVPVQQVDVRWGWMVLQGVTREGEPTC